ncbi:MAG: adenosylcobalamin-dependent ribonucleoside-diphosphate reductase [Candidatus Omnitrophica bacterium]|nr:adenosylcobalamin-dependent ribonucleoside-diphosphate reductase [Candidatus Omnitrophota bacterium]
MIPLSPNALRVLERRYLKRRADGSLAETPEEMFRRVAVNVAAADRLYNPQADGEGTARRFYELMAGLTFLPNSPALMNAGRELQQLHACFVLPVEDSLESIFEAIKESALIQQSGGGTGFSFSRLRPKGSPVKTTSGIASGPVSFLKVFDAATQAIKQGSFRRGANMGILRVDHPDILEFIRLKEDPQAMTNFNLSVAATDPFMEAVERDGEYDLVDPSTRRPAARLKAREVFKRICRSAWACGDPGMIFLDRINQANPTPDLGPMESTNPCGELPLLSYEACVLGSINLSQMVKDGPSGPEVDWARLEEVVGEAAHFLDNAIDASHYPLASIEAITKANRKIGLGVMGLAHLFIRLGIRYDSEEAIELARELMSRIQKGALEASQRLAKERGAFPNFDRSIYRQGPPRRNATLTTVAPTGTLSIIANTSSGIEPIFAVSYVRQVLEGEELLEMDPWFERIARSRGFWSEALLKRVSAGGTVRGDRDVPAEVQPLFATAQEISPLWHLKMQAAFQRFTENAISKTINMPAETTPEQVEEIYLEAWRLRCKGITIYRNKSRPSQVLNLRREE